MRGNNHWYKPAVLGRKVVAMLAMLAIVTILLAIAGPRMGITFAADQPDCGNFDQPHDGGTVYSSGTLDIPQVGQLMLRDSVHVVGCSGPGLSGANYIFDGTVQTFWSQLDTPNPPLSTITLSSTLTLSGLGVNGSGNPTISLPAGSSSWSLTTANIATHTGAPFVDTQGAGTSFNYNNVHANTLLPFGGTQTDIANYRLNGEDHEVHSTVTLNDEVVP